MVGFQKISNYSKVTQCYPFQVGTCTDSHSAGDGSMANETSQELLRGQEIGLETWTDIRRHSSAFSEFPE